MSAVTQFMENTYPALTLIFVASNLAVMGLQVKMSEVFAALKDLRTLALILVWGWVVGPALGLLIAWILPLSEAFVIGLLLYSLAPCAPFLPLPAFVPRARGDMSYAGAVVPLVAVGTVILTPLMAPFMIEGLAISSGALAKLFLGSVLLPLVIGAAVRHYAPTVGTKLVAPVNLIAKLSALGTIVYAFVLYSPQMLETVGSFGLLSMTIFMVVIGWITYRFGFGLKQNQRSVMSLAMLSRNGSVVLVAAFAIPDVDPSIVTYVIMYILWSIVLAAIASRIFGKIAGKTVAGNTA